MRPEKDLRPIRGYWYEWRPLARGLRPSQPDAAVAAGHQSHFSAEIERLERHVVRAHASARTRIAGAERRSPEVAAAAPIGGHAGSLARAGDRSRRGEP